MGAVVQSKALRGRVEGISIVLGGPSARPCKAEISELHNSVENKNVLGLDVQVHHLIALQKTQPVRNLAEEREEVGLGEEGLGLHDLVQSGLAVLQLDEEVVLLDPAGVVRDDVRMQRQRRETLHLRKEDASTALPVHLPSRPGESLDGVRTPGDPVERKEHFGEAAPPQAPHLLEVELVVPQQGAGEHLVLHVEAGAALVCGEREVVGGSAQRGLVVALESEVVREGARRRALVVYLQHEN